jgi:hypothetical protein
MSAPPDRGVQRATLDRVDALERQESALFASKARAVAAVAAAFGDDDPSVVLEVAGTCRVGQVKAAGSLDRHARLVTLFPVALGLLETGVMRVGTVQILLELTRNASAEVQRRLDAERSEQVCLLDAVDVRRIIASALMQIEAELDADDQRLRHEQALAGRRVWVTPVQDGMVRIGAEIGVLDARRWTLDFEVLVAAQKVVDDEAGVVRTQAQRRADVLAKLPSLALAVAEAAAKGTLADLLPETVLAAVQERAAVQQQAEAQERADAQKPLFPAPRTSPESSDASRDALPVDPSGLGMEELPLDLPPRTAPPCWQRGPEDLLGQLLSLPVRGPKTMHVHAAMTTLLDLDQRSGWIEGYGPVPAMHARILTPDADLVRVAVDARTGVPLGVDIPRNTPGQDRCPWEFESELVGRRHDTPPESGDPPHGPPGGSGPPTSDGDPPGGGGGSSGHPPVRPGPSSEALRQRARLLALLRPMYLDQHAELQHDPSRGLRRTTQIRDMCCDGPGCPRAATASDLDHEHDHAKGGPTAIWNLKHRSPRCHTCKHHGWLVEHDHGTGASTWTSPAGSVYERQAFWPVPTVIRQDALLPEPRIEPLLTIAPGSTTERDLPLWPAPVARPVRHGRMIDPATVDENGDLLAEALVLRRAGGGWDDGPPPF